MSVAVLRKPQMVAQRESLTARAYPNRIPDGEYIALCTHVHHDQHSRNYGERVYLDFQIYLGDYAGKTIRMFLRPCVFPTSNFYRAWAIAHGGPPRSRNTKMSSRVFKGKVFRVLTATVKPKNQITGDDGKRRPGPSLPESFWYSKVACLLNLQATNSSEMPCFVTEVSDNPLSSSDLSEGEVGRRELGIGSMQNADLAVRDGTTNATLHNQPVGATLPAPSPERKQQ